MKKITYLNEAHLEKQRVLVRADFDVALDENHTLADDARIKAIIPTIQFLLKGENKIILIAHAGRPTKRDPSLSLSPIVTTLQQFFPQQKVSLVEDFLSTDGKKHLAEQTPEDILVLENIRFYPGETENDTAFAKELARLGDAYVNDAFGDCHREHASIVGIPQFLPSYGGLNLEKEVEAMEKVIHRPENPFVAIIGGAKVADKLPLLQQLTKFADFLLLAGGIANTIFFAQGKEVGKSIHEPDAKQDVLHLLEHAKEHKTQIVLPSDVVVLQEDGTDEVKKIDDITATMNITDIGPETEATFGAVIETAKMIVWNGPVGKIEEPKFSLGTEFLYYAITQNNKAYSLIGGGDTLRAISQAEYLDKISHISTGGGAMLEYLEKGTLPGIEALQR